MMIVGGWCLNLECHFCGLYYKHITIVNDDSSVISYWHSPLIGNARVVIYDHTMFIIQATDGGRGIIYDRHVFSGQGTLTEGDGSVWLTSSLR
jgi:hypothetical protein